ncbi:hypothetical protein QBC46DRAFT_365333 [Diplogelasinospora grovesii]|uniref:Uncharacterized protein n=1 Tax=Diplogelasinospora grovesii TaxID=303347 RepID=A0AAN6S3P6_9PEZI|nr:hypothetical protein QBC46DRAFT_365333 [Diplogelasinospora grovesii]
MYRLQGNLSISGRIILPGALQAAADRRAKVPCRFFLLGQCRNGSNCVFRHSGPPQVTAAPNVAEPLQTPSDSRSQIPCRFEAWGSCRNGDACPFAHSKETEVLVETEAEESATADNWVRPMVDGLVHFGDGTAISKISLRSDFSSVQLNRLPAGSSSESVALFLSTLGVTVPPTSVRVLPQITPNATHRSAYVRVEDPLFAKTVSSKIGSLPGASRGVEAVAIASPLPQTSSLPRVDCRRVTLSWYRPTRTVWLNFGSQDIARKVQAKFDFGEYTILDQGVKASGPTGVQSGRNPMAWNTDFADVQKPIKLPQPRHIELGKPNYTVDPGLACATVKSLLLDIGPLEWWQDSRVDTRGKRMKSQARFIDETDARKAVRILNYTELPFGKKIMLSVAFATTAKFRVGTPIYKATRSRIEPYKDKWKAQHLHFVEYPPDEGYQVLKVEGANIQDVAGAKNVLEKILAGDIAKNGDEVLWSASLSNNKGKAYQNLLTVEKALDIVIMRDRRKSQLKLFGPEAKCKRACDFIAAIVREDDTSAFAIDLTPEQFRWACQGGFKAVSAALSGDGGVAAATFDIVSDPKRILITGSRREFERALALIASQQGVDVNLQSQSGVSKDCSVCWCPADKPVVRTKCGHVYCGDCFENLCQSDASTESAIQCKGDEDKCKRLLTLAELQESLSSSTFEELLEASFKSYINRHPLDFRYCPSPNCEQIYRVGAPGTYYTCTNCLAVTCKACHNPHDDGMTCAEYKDIASGGGELLKKVKKELGIKDCPKCKTALDKTEGCNHMTCGGCQTHICWKCMVTFPQSDLCYTHMTKEHGGIGLGYLDDD